MKVVLKIGGSIIYDNQHLDTTIITKYVDIIKNLVNKGHQITVIVGGGRLARNIIKASKEIGGVNTYQDIIGVEVSRIHALLFIGALGDIAYQTTPRSFDQLREALSTGKVICMGGLQPAQSTNAVASLVAEIWRADMLINLSDVSKVYDKDPKKYPDAKGYDRISIDEFVQIIERNTETPGSYDLFDKVGVEIIKRSKIKLVFTNGKKPENILKIIKGEKVGTTVYH